MASKTYEWSEIGFFYQTLKSKEQRAKTPFFDSELRAPFFKVRYWFLFCISRL